MEKKQFMTFRLDDSVLITFLITAVLASLAFAVKYNNYRPCKAFTITTPVKKIRTGEMVRFEASVKDFSSLKWDFGDNQFDVTKLPSAIHSYDYPGEYVITLTVDEKCVEYKYVTVELAPEIVDSTLVPRAIIPDTGTVGRPLTFVATSPNATSWQWMFGETSDIDRTTQTANYVYAKSGVKTVMLYINGDKEHYLVKKIFISDPKMPDMPRPVIVQQPYNPRPQRRDFGDDPSVQPIDKQGEIDPKPATPEPEPAPVPKYPDISAGEFRQLLYTAVEGKNGPPAFAKYFCDGNTATYVKLNGEGMTFNELCTKLAAEKQKNIKTFQTTIKKNSQTNCITSVEAIVKVKRGLLGMTTRDLQ